MQMPDDIDDAFAMFQQMAEGLDDLLKATEDEQAAGRSGYQRFLEATRLSEDLHQFGQELTRKIDQARARLS